MPALGSGTFATYQGLPCLSVRLVRSRGIGSDRSTVTIPIESWEALSWRGPSDVNLDEPPPLEVPTTIAGSFAGPVGRMELPRELRYEGTLVLSEDPSHVMAVPGLAILRVETEQGAESGPPFVRLTLVDVRAFWSRGLLARWSYNLQDGDFVRQDTIKEDGTLFSLAEVLDDVAGSLWRRPDVTAKPAGLASDLREVAFAPWAQSSVALQELANLAGAEEPCLRLDNTIALHEPGDGKLGWARNGEGPNAEPIPPEFILDEEGRGRRDTAEKGWPDEYLVFVGLPRIASVALDEWEPVLLFEGAPFYLSEQLVRDLTDQKHGLDWLQKFVLLPSADQGSVRGVDDRVLKLLREQAYRYWRLPGAELRGGRGAVASGPILFTPGENLLSAGAAVVDAALGAEDQGYYTGAPGPNAHLLPLLDRAETTGGGRRLPPRVEAFGFEEKRRKFEASAATAALVQVNRERAALRSAAATRAAQSAIRNPFDYGNPPARPRAARNGTPGLSIDDFNGGALLPAGLERERVEYYLRELRRANLLRELSPDLAQRYEQTLRSEAEAGAASGRPDQISLELARQLVGLEGEAADSFFELNPFNSAAVSQANLREALLRQSGAQARSAIEQAAQRSAQLRRRSQGREAAALNPEALMGPVFLQNKRRTTDAGARVVSAELGIVRTSGLAGIVRDQGVHDRIMTSFKPMPVRVTFGARLRPRVDKPPTDRVPTQPGRLPEASDADQGPDNVVPQVLSARESYYASAWRRTGVGRVVRVEVEDVPLHRASRVSVRFQELVALTGISNRPRLDQQAEATAREMSRRKDEIRSQSLSVAGPWPVQCDGLISRVEVVMNKAGGAPCGFTTRVTIGGTATEAAPSRTRERGPSA